MSSIISVIRRKVGINNINERMVFALSFVLFLPILFDFITSVTRGNSSVYTYVLYIATLFLTLFKFRSSITQKSVLVLIALYIVVGINYVVFPESIEYISSTQTTLMLVFFLPLAFLIFKNITDWSSFVRIASFFCLPAILIGVYILLFTDVSSALRDDALFTYMEFSYALLPFVCLSFARYYESKNRIYLLLFVVGEAEMLAYGCRAALLYSILFVALVEFMDFKRHKTQLFLFFLVVVAIVLSFDTIISYLVSVDLFSNSYFLKHLLSGELFDHSTRVEIYDNCQRRLSTMGMEISGLFGDRAYCGSVYPHNIIYEMLMQFGWVLGSGILLYYLILFLKSVSHSNTRIIVLFFFCAVVCRFFVSDSYLQNGQFWIMTACIISISKPKTLPQ